jgi:hypothetical protein
MQPGVHIRATFALRSLAWKSSERDGEAERRGRKTEPMRVRLALQSLGRKSSEEDDKTEDPEKGEDQRDVERWRIGGGQFTLQYLARMSKECDGEAGGRGASRTLRSRELHFALHFLARKSSEEWLFDPDSRGTMHGLYPITIHRLNYTAILSVEDQ